MFSIFFIITYYPFINNSLNDYAITDIDVFV